MRRIFFIVVSAVSLCAVAFSVTGCGKDKDDGLEFDPAPVRIQRLLTRQYENTVRDLVGDQAVAAVEIPADVRAEGFAVIGAATLSLSDIGINQYEITARNVAEIAAADSGFRNRFVTCTPASATDAACHGQFVTEFGYLAWRRPLTQDEIDRYVSVAVASASDYDDFYKGVEYAVVGLLQSPYFIYQVHVGEPHDTGKRKLSAYELAGKMSFFLLDTTPSKELLDAAGAGELDNRDQLRARAEQMLQDASARDALGEFYSERFHLEKLDAVFKDSAVYPDFSQGLAQDMKEEAFRFMENIVFEEDTDFRELFVADYTFVNSELADIYGVTPPQNNSWIKRTLPPEQNRSGIFSQAGFLSVESHPVLTSPTRRGRAVQERLLCSPIPPPPPEVDPTLPPPAAGETLRDVLEANQQNEQCAGCHVLMDNIGFGLENYDAIGRYRTFDNGYPIDATGTVAGIGNFEFATGLGDLLYDEPKLTDCWVRNTFRHSLAHVETDGEEPVIEFLGRSFANGDYRIQELLVELVVSEPFRVVGELD